MMLTRRIVLGRLDSDLNNRFSLAELVAWAENALIEPKVRETEDAEAVLDVVAYLGAADSKGFPLTWAILTGFVAQLGGTLTAGLRIGVGGTTRSNSGHWP
jgi:hypothetical protein